MLFSVLRETLREKRGKVFLNRNTTRKTCYILSVLATNQLTNIQHFNNQIIRDMYAIVELVVLSKRTKNENSFQVKQKNHWQYISS